LSRIFIDRDGGEGGAKGAAFLWILALSVLLCWLPFVGPLLAGFKGGRVAVKPLAAFWAAIIPAALWAGLYWWLGSREITIGGDQVQAAPLRLMGPLTAVAILGGALLGSHSRGGRVLANIALIAVLVWFVPQAREVWSTLAPIFKIADSQPYEPSKNKTCPENLQQLYSALQFYTDEWDALPPADRWMTAIQDKVPKDQYLHCPEVLQADSSKFGYAMNPELAGKPLRDIEDRKATPLFYDSTELGKNAHSGPDSIPQPGRHSGRSNILYADGHVEAR
jgi:prepilin-type processing-associated H-X9-DG protein